MHSRDVLHMCMQVNMCMYMHMRMAYVSMYILSQYLPGTEEATSCHVDVRQASRAVPPPTWPSCAAAQAHLAPRCVRLRVVQIGHAADPAAARSDPHTCFAWESKVASSFGPI